MTPRVHVGRKKKKKDPQFFFLGSPNPQKKICLFCPAPAAPLFFYIIFLSFYNTHFCKEKCPQKIPITWEGSPGGYRYFTDKLKTGLRHISKGGNFQVHRNRGAKEMTKKIILFGSSGRKQRVSPNCPKT